jgi:hypothetical protein
MVRLLSFCSAKKKVTKKKAALRACGSAGARGQALRVMLCHAELYSSTCRISDQTVERRSIIIKVFELQIFIEIPTGGNMHVLYFNFIALMDILTQEIYPHDRQYSGTARGESLS